MRPLAQLAGLGRLDVDDDVGARDGPLDRLLDGVGGGMALADRRARRHADDDVGEVPPGRAAHAQAVEGHAGPERLDALCGRPRPRPPAPGP